MTTAEARAPERSVPERTPFKSLASRPGAIVYTADFAFRIALACYFFLKTLPLTTRSLLNAHKNECAGVARPLRPFKG